MVALANALGALGLRVDLVLLCGTGPYASDVDSEVRIVDLDARNAALAAIRYLRYLTRERPDAVLSTLIAPNALAVAGRYVLPTARVVVREANTLSVALRYRPWPNRLLAAAVVRLAYPRADGIVAVSKDAAADLVRFLGLAGDRVQAIATPFSITMIQKQAMAEVDHPWFGVGRSEPVIVAAGRLVKKKGFDILVEAFALVRRVCPARLQILGEGEERRELGAQIARLGLGGFVELPGFVGNPFARLARADLFVLASLAEGSPNILVEAMACGCPVVATRCPSGPREILREGRDGILVPPGDAKALAKGMLEGLARPRESAKLRARAELLSIGSVGAYAAALKLSTSR